MGTERVPGDTLLWAPMCTTLASHQRQEHLWPQGIKGLYQLYLLILYLAPVAEQSKKILNTQMAVRSEPYVMTIPAIMDSSPASCPAGSHLRLLPWPVVTPCVSGPEEEPGPHCHMKVIKAHD